MPAVITSTDTPEVIQAALTSKKVEVVAELGDDKGKPDGAAGDTSSAETPKGDESSADSATAGDSGKGTPAEESKVDKLLKEVGELKGRLEAQTPKPKPNDSKPAAPDPKADAEPKPEDFDTQADFLKALSKWATKEARKEEKAEQAKNAAAAEDKKVVDTWREQVKTAKAKYPDWDKVMTDIEIGKTAGNALLHSPDGAEIAYYIGKNPKEAENIVGLKSERDVLMYIGELRARLKKPDTNTGKPASEKPKPITPVNGSSSSTVDKPPAEMSFQEYKAKRNKEIAARRARA